MLSITESTWRWLTRMAFASAIIVISYLAFTSDPPELATRMSDKINHGFAFLVLALVLDQTFAKMQLLRDVALPLLGYGLFIEVVQGQLGYREMSWLDIGADAMGVLVYAVCRPFLRAQIAKVVSLRSAEH